LEGHAMARWSALRQRYSQVAEPGVRYMVLADRGRHARAPHRAVGELIITLEQLLWAWMAEMAPTRSRGIGIWIMAFGTMGAWLNRRPGGAVAGRFVMER